MSLDAYIWAANLPLDACTGTQFRVLLQLADRADKLGYGAYPGVAAMAGTLKCSERTIYRALAELRTRGLIREGDQRYVEHIDPRYRPTVYDVLTTALCYLERASEVRDDSSVTPSDSRGDRNRHPGVTSGVSRTALVNPLTKTYSDHLQLVTAQESGMSR